MKKLALIFVFTLVLSLFVGAVSAFAEDGADTPPAKTEESADTSVDNGSAGTKAFAAAGVIAAVATAGAIGMAIAISKSVSSMSRQPEAAGKINSAMMLGLVFIETAIIYALIVAILIIFVL